MEVWLFLCGALINQTSITWTWWTRLLKELNAWGSWMLGILLALVSRLIAVLGEMTPQQQALTIVVVSVVYIAYIEVTRMMHHRLGKQLYNASKAENESDMAALKLRVQELSGHEVLNWANPDKDGRTPLIVSSEANKVEAVKLLLKTPGEMKS